MKFLTILALFGGISAIKLGHQHEYNALQAHSTLWSAQVPNQLKGAIVNEFLQNQMKSQWPKLTKEQQKEIHDWVVEELTTGEKTITKQEAHDAIVAFCDKHGLPEPTDEEWDKLEEMFDAVDTNGDGAIDLPELKAAMKKHGPGKKGKLQMRLAAQQFIQAQVQWPKLTKEQEKEIHDWVVEELTTGEKTITKQEAHDAIVAFADKHGFRQPTAEEWEKLEEMFDAVDTNGDGAIDLPELKAAMKKHGHHADVQLNMAAKQFIQAQVQWPKLTKEQEKEIHDWVVEELTTGEKTITKEEAHDAIVAFAKKHGFRQPTAEEWEKLEEMFDAVDTNGDGAIDLPELKAAMKKHGHHEDVQLRQGAQKFIQTQVSWPKLTKAQQKEIEDWVVEELTTGEKTITKQEAHDAIVAFADKHGLPQPTAEEWEKLEEVFDYVDANGDGAIDLPELKAAMKKHCPKHAKLQIKLAAQKFIQTQVQWPKLTKEQEQEIHDWVVEELTTGEKTITKEEAHDAIVAFAKKHGFRQPTAEEWEKLEEMFDAVDTNGDGAIDLPELKAAMKKHGHH